ncbi:long-chain fatty acid--CoA ligase [Corynebacterium afermentans subsp. lipophilum]|uniref:AMP-dependent synthetase/ligase n=1 Tax=Corynebacterium afermentans TaxID=38286 RepID=UPI00188A5F06|nr:long-chain fatty acid--CoA ligase [Corynebacterium afermentans]MBF4547038.1 long-chain fatty acid--CoA ligase [Corynebacterium afermentans subsp. lipophilum]WJY59400.1 Long-chain-fatty-acid--CoA ligase FadD15 [Corynebacterium afermentans subsp. lipophilum]
MPSNAHTTELGFTLADTDTCLSRLIRTCEQSPHLVLYYRPRNYEWVSVTAAEFLEEVYEVAKGLVAAGIQPGDRVAILSSTRYEWSLVDFAIWAAGAASVPIYPSSSMHQIQWILEDSGAKIAFTETRDHTQLMSPFLLDETGKPKFADSPSKLERIYEFNAAGVETLKFEGRDVEQSLIDERVAAIRHETLGSIVYTSGTTGRPKGVEISHGNWAYQCWALLENEIGSVSFPGQRMVTFLPLAHVLARAVSLAWTISGATQSHWSDTSTLMVELQRVRPNLVVGVPRVFEKVREGAYNKAADGSAIGKRMFLEAEKAAIEYSKALETDEGPSRVQKAKRAVYDKVVYGKIKEAMGGSVWYGITGGSAMSADLSHFFRGMGVPIYEGYGLTETCAAACVNNANGNKIGTVGRPVNGYSVRINDDGEIEFKGPGVFDKYWKNPAATEEALTDGWFNTGDLGEVDDEGYVSITGRKKDLIVTAGGKNISPGPMEEIIRQDPLISNALVVGDGKPFVGVLVTLDEEELKRWKANHNIPANKKVSELAQDPALRAEVQDAVNLANATVSRTEAIKKFRILDRDLSEQHDEMTPTMKVKRNVVFQRFQEDIDKLYQR